MTRRARLLILGIAVAVGAGGATAREAQRVAAPDAQARVEAAIAEPASVSELTSAIGDCVSGMKVGAAGQAAMLTRGGWTQLAPTDTVPQPSGAPTPQTPFVKGHVVILLNNVGGAVGQPCRLLARAASRSTAGEVRAASIARFKVEPLTSTSAFLRRNPGISAETRASFLENPAVLLRIKFDADAAAAPGYLNIVVAPNV